VKAVEATGRKTLVMAGVWTSVCVAFPALQAQATATGLRGDRRVGDPSEMARRTTLAASRATGIVP